MCFQISVGYLQSAIHRARNTSVGCNRGEITGVSAFVKTNNLSKRAKIQLRITYSNNDSKSLNMNIKRGTRPYSYIRTGIILQRDATHARVRIATGQNKGIVLIDDLSLIVSEATAPLTTIPIPAAPDLRGQ